ncbi:MAG: HNH endonuclease signature motif containing protein [Corynebacterium sp.]|nr:HNH endonuclease signature motif containing protein [Corynebacterium sp.]
MNDSAYSQYLAAKQSGWALLSAFYQPTAKMTVEAVAHRDGLPVAEVRRLRLTYQRIRPQAALATALGHSLDMLELIGKMFAKLRDTKVDNLALMLQACKGLTMREAEFTLQEIVNQNVPKAPRRNRINFARRSDGNHMTRVMGLLKTEHARAIQARAEKHVKTAMAKNPGLKYDNALGNWMVSTLLNDNAAPADAPQPAFQPMIILAGDPNVDVARGHLNTLSGASIPLAEAVNQKLAGTGWVAWTRRDETGRIHLDAIVPITRSRFSTGMHRVGVVLESLVCAHESCDLPALFCQAHHLKSVAYHGGETSWENMTPVCRVHNVQNDDNPNAPPKNGRLIRDDKGWVGHQAEPGGPLNFNTNPLFRQGYRGTAEDMAANFVG